MTTEQTPVTFGPRDLDSFIATLRLVSSTVSSHASSELLIATRALSSALAIWTDAIERSGSPLPATSVPAAPTSASTGRIIEDAKHIETLLSRMILRHSSFGFAAANCPSDLDRHFPGGEALIQIHRGRRHLRAALSSIEARPLVSAR